MNDAPSTVGLIIFLTVLGLLPFFIVTMTAFLKISVVMFIIRNALGLQQTPPTLVLYSIALILTVFVSLPLIEDVSNRLAARPLDVSFARQAPGIGQCGERSGQSPSHALCETRRARVLPFGHRPHLATGPPAPM